MVREAKREELMEILELYLHLHETSIRRLSVSTKKLVITEAIRRPLFSGWASL